MKRERVAFSSQIARAGLCFVLVSMFGPAVADDAAPNLPQPEQSQECSAFYVDIPSAGNPVANIMLGTVVGKAVWMDQLKTAMSLGRKPPTTRLVVAGQSEDVVRKAMKSALDSFKDERLPYLTLIVVGQSEKMQALESRAAQSGVAFHILPPNSSAKSAEDRASAYLPRTCD